MALLVAYSSVACGGAPNAKPLSADTANAPKDSPSSAENAPVSAPAGVIAVGRARDYRQWVKLEQASPVVAYLLTEECAETGSVFVAGGGSVYRVAQFQNLGVRFAEPPSVGLVAERWSEIIDMSEAVPGTNPVG